jgi:hypothetical protein
LVVVLVELVTIALLLMDSKVFTGEEEEGVVKVLPVAIQKELDVRVVLLDQRQHQRLELQVPMLMVVQVGLLTEEQVQTVPLAPD